MINHPVYKDKGGKLTSAATRLSENPDSELYYNVPVEEVVKDLQRRLVEEAYQEATKAFKEDPGEVERAKGNKRTKLLRERARMEAR